MVKPKLNLSRTPSATFNQRFTEEQRHFASAARLCRRQLQRAIAGEGCAALQRAGQPRRWAIVASLFGGADLHPHYVAGALTLAKELSLPWSLWLATDEATVAAWGAQLRAAPNIHLVLVSGKDDGAPAVSERRRPRVSAGAHWSARTFTRFLLLDDASLAGGVVVDLDVESDAAASAVKLWRSSESAIDETQDAAFGVVSYFVGKDRGHAGTNFTWNAGQAAASFRLDRSRPKFSESIAAFISKKCGPANLLYGCDEMWLASDSPFSSAMQQGSLSVYQDDGVSAIIPPFARRPGGAQVRQMDSAISRLPTALVSQDKVKKLVAGFFSMAHSDELRAVHTLLTGPSKSVYEVEWLDGLSRDRYDGRHAAHFTGY